jgi:hypothetical protein
MTAGLPGTGIGGLFYLMLVCWMPCRELYRLCRRRSTLRRWLDIAFYASVTVAIVVTMWGEAWLLSQILTRAATAVGILRPGTGQGYQVLGGRLHRAVVRQPGSGRAGGARAPARRCG